MKTIFFYHSVKVLQKSFDLDTFLGTLSNFFASIFD